MDVSTLLDYAYGIDLISFDDSNVTLEIGTAVSSIHDRRAYGIIVEIKHTITIKKPYYGVLWSIAPRTRLEYPI